MAELPIPILTLFEIRVPDRLTLSLEVHGPMTPQKIDMAIRYLAQLKQDLQVES